MRHLMTSLVALLAITMITALPALAQDDQTVPDPQEETVFGRGFGPRMQDEMNITTEQRTKMRDLRNQHQKEMIPLRADLRVARIELRELIQKSAAESTINAKIDQIGTLRTQLEKKRVAHQLEMRSLLTPEQLEKWDMGRGGRGMGPGHGERGMGPCRDGDDRGSMRGPRGKRMGQAPGCGRF